MFKIGTKRSNDKVPCPVCGYGLDYPPDDFVICPSCGVEFGYETAGRSFAVLRDEWVSSGARWASRVLSPPDDWNAWAQLIRAGYSYALPFHFQIEIKSPSIIEGADYKINGPIPVFS